ncbi:RNA-guided endonuclease IscB [Clostridium sp. FP1]|uniref:RNA-guided endonuclease IscB n=1 Tax=Clostridium sp. FP1 TaxID=2724076 RepID=UPI0013E938EB|nr:RNA-guided endonuclease IscB [Clostridium sp. FP1]MBZ9637345.1 HNH endonuclease [Clostridium sp. FP1]
MVFVLSKNKKSQSMCSNAKARVLLSKGYAVVHKVYPFTIRLKKEVDNPQQPKEYKLKIDPGSKGTGLSIIDNKDNVVFLATIEHRGQVIVSKLETRSGARRNRRQRETRYRKCKFINYYLKKGSKYKATSPRPLGWLPPSIKSIEQNIVSWTKKLSKLCNITSASIEVVSFDMQFMDNPNIEGVEYQQGTLLGYEIRAYLFEKYGHKCQYCNGVSDDNKLEIEHMISVKNGGSYAIKNLSLACHTCNDAKGSLNLAEWFEILKSSRKTKLNIERIKYIEPILKNATIHKPKRFGAWVNSYKNALIDDVRKLIDNVELSSGGRTMYNRIGLKLPKEHYYDALCVGEIPKTFKFKTNDVLSIKAYGRGSHFRGRTNKCGIITNNLPRQKYFFGFQTGDIVTAIVLKGKKQGKYFGRVAVRSSGFFNIQTKDNVVQGISRKYFTIIQRNDGYSYNIITRNKKNA